MGTYHEGSGEVKIRTNISEADVRAAVADTDIVIEELRCCVARYSYYTKSLHPKAFAGLQRLAAEPWANWDRSEDAAPSEPSLKKVFHPVSNT